MPIYEFGCNHCAAQFEQLCSVNWQGAVLCPVCGGADLGKIVSAFASPGASGSRCGSCPGKNCGACK